MKSSSNAFLGKDSQRKISAWAPAEIEYTNPKMNDVSVDEILDLFIGNETNEYRKNRGSNQGRAVFSASETEDILTWMPTQEYEVPEPHQKSQNTRPFLMNPSINQQQRQQQQNRDFSSITKKEVDHKLFIDHLKSEAEKAAQQVLAEAQEKAQALIKQAEQESEMIIAQAHEQLNEAMEKAHTMGLQEAEEETRTILQTVNSLMDQVSAWKEEVVSQAHTIVIDIVRDISKTMFGSGVVLDEKTLQQNLTRIMENAKNIGNLKLYLNPSDAVKLDPYWREFQASMTGNKVQIIPSDDITPGGCFIHGDMGTVDARIETQMRSIMQTLSTDFSQTEDY